MKKGTTLNVGDLILSEMREYKPFSFVPHLKKNPEKILHHVCTNNTSPIPHATPGGMYEDVQELKSCVLKHVLAAKTNILTPVLKSYS